MYCAACQKMTPKRLQLIRIRKVTYPAKAYVFPLASGSLIALTIAFATSTTCEKQIQKITKRTGVHAHAPLSGEGEERNTPHTNTRAYTHTESEVVLLC